MSNSSAVFAEARFDPAQLDQFAFASRKIPEYMHHRLLRCSACDLVYASPVPDLSNFQSFYEQAAFDSQKEAGLAAKTYAQLINSFAAKLPNREGALDIGTGDGAFLAELKCMGFSQLRGIEPSTAPMEAATAEVREFIDHGFFEPNRYASESFALVTCFQTIEHVEDPLGLATEANRILKPGGIHCLVGHNRNSLSARLLGRRSPIFDIEHLQLFSIPSIRRLLTQAGFESVQVSPIWNRYPLSYWARLFPFPLRFKRALIGLLNATGIGKLMISIPAGNLVAWGTKPATNR
jgi:SAM-dependent methyltransferase